MKMGTPIFAKYTYKGVQMSNVIFGLSEPTFTKILCDVAVLSPL